MHGEEEAVWRIESVGVKILGRVVLARIIVRPLRCAVGTVRV